MWYFNKLLGISGLEILNCRKTDNKIIFNCCLRRKTSRYPNYNEIIKTNYDKRVKTVKHGVFFDKICILRLTLKRFFCLKCKKTFIEQHPLIKKYNTTTFNFKKELILSLSSSSFSSNTKKYKVSYPTQRKYLKEIVLNLIFDFSKEEKEGKPFVLGIDEVSFSGKNMLTTIGNITKRKLKGVLYSRKKSELKTILKNLSPKVKSQIKEVVIDMCKLYKRTALETLPKAKIIIDKFHLIYDAQKRIEEERLFLQQIYNQKIPKYIFLKSKEKLTDKETKFLNLIFKKYKEINMFYQTKERIRELYRCKTREKAYEQLTFIISTLKSSDDGNLICWGRTLERFKNEILNYWHSYSTNGFMEGMNNKIKLIKRLSFGFKNKEIFIYKVMLSVLIFSLFTH
ncbi:MAG: ISL3 family transposase, partial [Minisyncoccia bacterium]